jgi:hypothetical protein
MSAILATWEVKAGHIYLVEQISGIFESKTKAQMRFQLV